MIHQLKIESRYFKRIIEGTKTFEVRKADKDFCNGDYLGLNEVALQPCSTSDKYIETGNFALVKVLDVFCDNRFVKEGYVIMSIRPCSIKEADWDYTPWYTRKNEDNPIQPGEHV